MAIINGRRIDPNSIPNSGTYGRDLLNNMQVGQGRRPIVESGGKVQQIDPIKRYMRDELVDKYGRGAKLTTMPDRSKGSSFGGLRSRQSRAVITEQVVDIAENRFKQGLDFDEDNADWLVVPNYALPANWHHIARNTALMVLFPLEYPALPPVGFYLPDDLPMAHDGHFFKGAFHGASTAPIHEGWKWYCVYIHEGAWQPAVNWRNGDNLWTYFHLISEALGN